MFHYLRVSAALEYHELYASPTSACVVGDAVAFAVNAALVSS